MISYQNSAVFFIGVARNANDLRLPGMKRIQIKKYLFHVPGTGSLRRRDEGPKNINILCILFFVRFPFGSLSVHISTYNDKHTKYR